ncbi:MAG: fatty acid desaturase [Hyphomicrobium sp.]|nr:fatty acid desaturase [Hyphomicrobium sp.]
MQNALTMPPVAASENQPLQSRVDGPAVLALKARDNATNWKYLAIVWGIIGATTGAALYVESLILASGASLWWMVPVVVLAAIVTGGSQHQLGGVIHEGTHFTLFENKRLNELASDWLGAFAIYTSTYQYRVHHLAHHQFVNDPERDPDISQLKDSDHWLDFPVAHIDVLKKLAKQLYLPNLVRFTLVRARYSAVGHDDNPYVDKSETRSKLPVYAGIYFAVAIPFIVSTLLKGTSAATAWTVLIASYLAVIGYFARLPESQFPQTRLLPVISHRATAIGRMTFLFLLYAAFTAYDSAAAGTGVAWAFDHYGLFWAMPLFTTFPLYMMMRQWVQHGNADRGRYTNTRVFLTGPLFRYCVLPWGMDYHLPHHMMASVPHYNLKALHELLLADPKYKAEGLVVEGVIGHHHHDGKQRPNILDVIGPDFAPKQRSAAHVDNNTLEYAEVRGAAAIAREAALSASGRPSS